MGGIGSGNLWRYGTRDTCEGSLRIDIRYMRTKGMLGDQILSILTVRTDATPECACQQFGIRAESGGRSYTGSIGIS
jgi:hypothetical protein